jgi:hypothetical protein
LDWVGPSYVRSTTEGRRVRRQIGRVAGGLVFERGGEARLGLRFGVIVEFGVGIGKGLFGYGGEEFFEGHASEPDCGVGQGPVRVVIGIGFGFGFGFLGFAEFEESFGDADFGHEFGDFRAGTVAHETEFGFHFVEGFRSKAVAFIWKEFFLDVRAFGPFPEFFFFFVGGVGLAEDEPIALDLEVIVGDCGTPET